MHIFRAEFGNLIKHFFVVVAVIKVRAIVKPDAVERRHQAQIDMVFHVAATQRKKLCNEVRQGDDGGARIKGKTILFVHIGSAARRIQFLEHLNAITFDAQTNGGCQATKSCADHNGCGCTMVNFGVCARGVVLIATATARAAVCVN